jgi:hypothetical protein
VLNRWQKLSGNLADKQRKVSTTLAGKQILAPPRRVNDAIYFLLRDWTAISQPASVGQIIETAEEIGLKIVSLALVFPRCPSRGNSTKQPVGRLKARSTRRPRRRAADWCALSRSWHIRDGGF